MNGGKIIGAGAPADLRAKTGQATLDAAFIALLPERSARDHAPIIVPAVAAGQRRRGDRGERPHLPLRRLHRRRPRELPDPARRDLRLSWLQRLRQVDDDEDADRPAGVERGRGAAVRRAARRQRYGDAPSGRLHVAELLALLRTDGSAESRSCTPGCSICRRRGSRRASRKCSQRFDLGKAADARPDDLPLGLRQRLQLAVAVIHRPEVLILDEPTSGVDPVARDLFWRMLVGLSRDDGVTIFISTHFMNEAERCDRISLMHAGKVLAVGAPAELAARRGKSNLEETFIAYLEEVTEFASSSRRAAPFVARREASAKPRQFDPRRLWAYVRRETMEIMRDRLRMAFALLGPLTLMLTFGYGISFDVENLSYAVYDQDNSLESRELLENFSGSRYFREKPEASSAAEIDRRLATGDLTLAIEIPSGFGRDLVSGKTPQVAVWIDGAMPFRAETIRSYIAGISQVYLRRAVSTTRPDFDSPRRSISRRDFAIIKRSRASIRSFPASSCSF